MRTILTSVLLLGASLASAEPFQAALDDNTPTKVVPETGARGTPLGDAPAPVANGQLVRVANTTYFYTGSGGSFTSAQAESSADFVNLLGNKDRVLAVVQNQGATPVWLGFGAPPAKDKGILLAPDQSIAFTDRHAQVAIYALSDGAGGKVGGQR